jgi:hypothetical protein
MEPVFQKTQSPRVGIVNQTRKSINRVNNPSIVRMRGLLPRTTQEASHINPAKTKTFAILKSKMALLLLSAKNTTAMFCIRPVQFR